MIEFRQIRKKAGVDKLQLIYGKRIRDLAKVSRIWKKAGGGQTVIGVEKKY